MVFCIDREIYTFQSRKSLDNFTTIADFVTPGILSPRETIGHCAGLGNWSIKAVSQLNALRLIHKYPSTYYTGLGFPGRKWRSACSASAGQNEDSWHTRGMPKIVSFLMPERKRDRIEWRMRQSRASPNPNQRPGSGPDRGPRLECHATVATSAVNLAN